MTQDRSTPVVWERITSVGNFLCLGCDYSGIIAGDPLKSGVHFCAGCGHPVEFRDKPKPIAAGAPK